MELGKGAVEVIVRCLKCGHEEVRKTPDGAEEDLKQLLKELEE